MKHLTADLGRIPTRGELEANYRGAAHALGKFGGFSTILQAAGLPTYDSRRTKIDKSVFEKDIEKHLDSYSAPATVKIKAAQSIAIISDIHWPFCVKKVIDAFISYVEKHKPEHVILNGDAWDMYSHAKFPRSHNVFTPKDEKDLSKRMNAAFWERVLKAHHKARCWQLLGNHDVRPIKRILESYPEAEDWIEKALRDDFSFPNVTTITDPRQELFIGNILIHHGFRSKLGAHRDANLFNSIVGHTHQGGVVFRNIRGETIWELNTGYAGDPESKGLSYTTQKLTQWTHGFGVVDQYGPRFIPV